MAVGASALATAMAGLRWLRVAQREHYLAGSCLRFARRWWTLRPGSAALGLVAMVATVASAWWPPAALGAALGVGFGPLGLTLRGRTAPLRATRRLKTLAAAWVLGQVAIVLGGWGAGAPALAAAAGAVGVPVVIDAALALSAPFERRLMGRFVAQAAGRLAAVRPVVVAVTGSYGKTSTKNHIAHLVGGTRAVVATPASFNNRAGLARAINEHLAEGTEVFVAEMGTYGPGEIAELCSWCPPQISVITAIGPVHLERFGTEEAILQAKCEILERATTAVLPIDDGRLAAVAGRLEAEGQKRVVRCSGQLHGALSLAGGLAGLREGDPPLPEVAVGRGPRGLDLVVGGHPVAEGLATPAGARPSNVACAVAVALALGVPEEGVAARLASLPPVANRLAEVEAPSGALVLDDTYNSNPAGARSALAALVDGGPGRRVLVTPGMVELGPRQAEANRQLAEEAHGVTDLVIVGRTNRRALLEGWGRQASRRPAVVVETREEAVAWVRTNVGPGDRVLYENDLPDHYP